MRLFAFLHHLRLYRAYAPRWDDFAALYNGEILPIKKPPASWRDDEWALVGGQVVKSREIKAIVGKWIYGY
jgi:hypothetical protein